MALSRSAEGLPRLALSTQHKIDVTPKRVLHIGDFHNGGVLWQSACGNDFLLSKTGRIWRSGRGGGGGLARSQRYFLLIFIAGYTETNPNISWRRSKNGRSTAVWTAGMRFPRFKNFSQSRER